MARRFVKQSQLSPEQIGMLVGSVGLPVLNVLLSRPREDETAFNQLVRLIALSILGGGLGYVGGRYGPGFYQKVKQLLQGNRPVSKPWWRVLGPAAPATGVATGAGLGAGVSALTRRGQPITIGQAARIGGWGALGGLTGLAVGHAGRDWIARLAESAR